MYYPSLQAFVFTAAAMSMWPASAAGEQSVIQGGVPVSENEPLYTRFAHSDESAFGGLTVTEVRPIIQGKFTHGRLDDQIVETLVESAARSTVTVSEYRGALTTGTAFGDYAVLRSKKYATYSPGEGVVSRFTTVFAEPTANVWQLAGPGNTGNGFQFGYKGTTFGIIYRRGGRSETATGTVTTGSTGGDVTFTLPNINPTTFAVEDTDYTITLDNATGAASTTNYTAADIVKELYADATFIKYWHVEASGSVLRFLYRGSSALTGGSYAFANVSAGAAMNGGINQIIAGSGNDYSGDVPQASWNGPGARLFVDQDWTLGNVFQIQYQWLGYGNVNFYIESSASGRFELVHTIRFPGSSAVTTVEDPNMHAEFAIYNALGAASARSMYVGSFMIGREGPMTENVPLYAASVTKSPAGSSADTALLTIRNRWVEDSGYNNYSIIVPREISLGTAKQSGSTRNTTFKVILNATFSVTSTSDYPTFTDNGGSAQTDTTQALVTGGTVIKTVIVSSDSSKTIMLNGTVNLIKDETITITGSNANTNYDLTVGVDWAEFE